MSIAKPFNFTANTYAKSSEVNADFDVVYSQVNTNISEIAKNAADIDNLESNKANVNGSSSQRFAVDNPVGNSDAINKQTFFNLIGNSIDYISGFIITKDSGSPEDTIIVSAGSCYDSTKTVVLSKDSPSTKQNDEQVANATYYVYVRSYNSGVSCEIAISTSSIKPDDTSKYRQIGYYKTDDENKISLICYFGNNANASHNAITLSDGESGYRIYSDGWCEQWGHSTETVPVEITFLKEFTDTNYNIMLTADSTLSTQGAGNTDSAVCFLVVRGEKATDKMKVISVGRNFASSYNARFYWKVSGYLAEGEY